MITVTIFLKYFYHDFSCDDMHIVGKVFKMRPFPTNKVICPKGPNGPCNYHELDYDKDWYKLDDLDVEMSSFLMILKFMRCIRDR